MTEHASAVSSMIDRMIEWAKGQIGNGDYAGWRPVERVPVEKEPDA